MNLNLKPNPNKSGRNTSKNGTIFFTVLPNKYTQFPIMGISPIPLEKITHENNTEVAPNHIAVSLSIQVVIRKMPEHKMLVQSMALAPDLKYLIPSLNISVTSIQNIETTPIKMTT